MPESQNSFLIIAGMSHYGDTSKINNSRVYGNDVSD